MTEWTYLLLCLVFLGVAVAVASAAAGVRSRQGRPAADGTGRLMPAAALAGFVLVLLTAVFDNLMIAVGLFSYAEESISGLRLGLAPIEDFAYPVAAVILLPALWTLLGPRRTQREAA
ncbi:MULTISPECIES: lycopene cyclase domain-containing protein [Actinomycetes]|uniref:Lycopene cyclase domain-containing protein n=2 Tax=Actinomycetes TaxID=1760 RepID=A0ABP6LUY2_9MICC|nr:lycopene cyclase domain-containing protein [Nesterenkonia sp. CL21]MDS2172291.1 lycopene cyclase domain-containing protein [Nesterenkonia sp. CL21]